MIKLFFSLSPSSIYTQYHMTKQKTVFRHFCKCIENKNMFLHMYSDPLLSTLLKHLWLWLQPRIFLGMTLQAWHTCIWGVSPILLFRSSQALSGWMGSIVAQLFSVSPEMFDQVQVWVLPGPLKDIETCPEATPVLSWLCAYGHCPFGRWTFAPVWGPEHSGAGFHQGFLCTFSIHFSLDPD